MKKLPKLVKLLILVIIVLACLRACGGGSRKPEPVPVTPAVVEETPAQQEAPEAELPEEPEEAEEEPEPVEEEPEEQESAPASGMRPEFKEAMDSYEAFYDEYIEFMKTYQDNPSDLKLLAQYADMVKQEAEMTRKFEAWDEDDMTDEELEYYLDVNLRIEKKLLDVM